MPITKEDRLKRIYNRRRDLAAAGIRARYDEAAQVLTVEPISEDTDLVPMRLERVDVRGADLVTCALLYSARVPLTLSTSN